MKAVDPEKLEVANLLRKECEALKNFVVGRMSLLPNEYHVCVVDAMCIMLGTLIQKLPEDQADYISERIVQALNFDWGVTRREASKD